MEVTLIPGIAAVSGTLCKTKNARVIFTTRKASSTNPNKVRMYVRSAESYKRTTPPSEQRSLCSPSILRAATPRLRHLSLQSRSMEDSEKGHPLTILFVPCVGI